MKIGICKIKLFLVAVAFLSLKVATCSAFDNYNVVDGDSLELKNLRIRLIDIDAPELFQECYDENNNMYKCGETAKKKLKSYVTKGITCRKVAVDIYKRSLMECFDEANKSINQKMVLNGWAVAYGDKFKKDEKIAKINKRGIWKGRFMRPELYRALDKNQKNTNKFEKR